MALSGTTAGSSGGPHPLQEAWREGRLYEGQLPGGAKTEIDVKMLRALLVGVGPVPTLPPGPVRLKGVVVKEHLDLSAVKARADGRPIPQFEAEDCKFPRGIDLSSAVIDGLWLRGCKIAGLNLRDTRIDGSLLLDGSTIAGGDDRINMRPDQAILADGLEARGDVSLGVYEKKRFSADGEISLTTAKIGRQFRADGASLSHPNGIALCCSGAEISDSVHLKSDAGFRFECVGGLDFTESALGALYLTGAAITQASGERAALDASGARIRGVVHLDGEPPAADGESFEISGEINFVGARADEFWLDGVVWKAPRTDGQTSACLDLEGLTVRDVLKLKNIQFDGPQGLVSLEDANAGRLIDDPDTAWPAPGWLRLKGFTYESLQGGHGSETRIPWLGRQLGPHAKFHPQPWEHLAGLLRKDGLDAEANRIAIDKRNKEIALVPPRERGWVVPHIMRLVGYGYDIRTASWWVFAWWVVGMVWIWSALVFGTIDFKRVHPAASDESMAYSTPWWRWQPAGIELEHVWNPPKATQDPAAVTDANCPGVVIPVYALELMVPIAEIGQASECRLESTGGFWPGAVQIWRAFYQVWGAFLLAVLGMALTGWVRKD